MKLLELAGFLKDQAVKRFPNKIAIIVLYGSTAQGKDDEFSDLDMFAIVDKQEESNLPWEFLFQGHTVDFWKIDWKQAELMASGMRDSSPWAVSAALFNSGEILYSRSVSDKTRFNSLVKKTKRSQEENLTQIIKDFNSGYSHLEEITLAKMNEDLLSARWAVWQLINKTVKNLSLINNSFLTKNWGANLHEVFQFPILPNNYSQLALNLSTTNNFDEMLELGRELLHNLRKLVLKEQQNFIRNQAKEKVFCNKYISMKAYINKILSACNKSDILAVSYAATELQIWIAEELAQYEGNLIVNVDNFNFFEEIQAFYNQLMLPDLMEGISSKNFQEIEKNANVLDFRLQEFCKNEHLKIPSFINIDEVDNYLE
ncbi:MAG: hypothetical protein JSU57_02490 [Candidatus Heimdallarchaeota archaeon]|nr:MAG: hypothetical protein JSU57_02490 [Candidatus Heimdallarchaeota archaeon]